MHKKVRVSSDIFDMTELEDPLELETRGSSRGSAAKLDISAG